jgi:hypothetical protein
MDADLTSHHIEGIAAHGDVPFRVPLYSQIEGNLWMGGCPEGELPKVFEHCVSLFPWGSYYVAEGQNHAKFWLLDSSQHAVPAAQFHAAADLALALTKLGPTLVHCQAGLNRSSVVTALVLMKLGRTPEAAIEIIREKRSHACLCNPSFERWIRDGAPLEA